METQGDNIRVLDKDTINKIAAGEVIERPASVVKELVDNSLDSGATDIRVEVEQGGKDLILVRDNGCGMSRKDAGLSFEKHATSKLRKIEDLESVATMGFRGEALSSIAAIAKVELVTRPREELEGTKMVIEGGKVESISDTGTAPGTSIQVKDLFYNTPVRRKYLKSNRTELSHITDIVMKLALANPKISFTLISERKTVLRNPGSEELFNTVVNLLGPETARSMLPLQSENTSIRGYVSKPELTRGGTDQLFLFINSRPVTSRALYNAIRLGYYTKIPKGRYPVAVLSLSLDPLEVDVNVHPRKTEVRFSQEKEVCKTVTREVEKALSEQELVPEIREKKPRMVQQAFRVQGAAEEQKTKQTSPLLIPVQEKPLKTPGFKAEGRPEVMENPETYSYPIRDTEKRLRRSERLLKDLIPEKEEKPEGKEKEGAEKTEIEIRGAEKPEIEIKGVEKTKIGKKGIEKAEREIEKRGEGKTEKYGKELRGTVKDKIETESSAEAEKQEKNRDSDVSGPLDDLRIIGQVSKVYILAEKAGNLVIIDQHAAHERILYEQVRKTKKTRVQELITPVTVELTPREKVLMEEYIPYLEEYGFGVSDFGDNTYVVTFVPDVFGRLEDPALIHDIISDILNDGKIKNETGVSEKVCKTLACRAAIKGGAACSPQQMEALIEQLKKAENPYSCPHGRPTIISFTKTELDRMFARIQ